MTAGHQQSRLRLMVRPALVVAGVAAVSLRAVNDLTNLRFLDAASSNLVFVAAIPVLAYWFGRWTYGRWSGRPWNPSARTQNRTVAVTLVVLGVFAALRNLPGSWLAP